MRINGKNVKNNGCFAYDNCHKIYILEDEQDKQQAIENKFNIISIEKLKETFENSCELRFINNWKLTTFYVEQFEDMYIDYNDYKQEYYIKYYSTMSGTSVYFVASNEQILKENRKLFFDFINRENEDDYYKLLKQINDKDIIMYCNEDIGFDENIDFNGICIEHYSYRF